jgi:hypothetical protein
VRRNQKILVGYFTGLLLLFMFIFIFIVYSKDKFTMEAIDSIRAKGGVVETDGEFNSRGVISNLIYKVSNAFGYDVDIGHKAYSVTLNDKFINEDIILLNAIPHVRSLHLNSPHMTNQAVLNTHGSELLIELHLSNMKCDGKALDNLKRFSQLKKLTLTSLAHVKGEDFAFVKNMKIESLLLIKMKVDDKNFASLNSIPSHTKINIEQAIQE